jgi:hypothetical protein
MLEVGTLDCSAATVYQSKSLFGIRATGRGAEYGLTSTGNPTSEECSYCS